MIDCKKTARLDRFTLLCSSSLSEEELFPSLSIPLSRFDTTYTQESHGPGFRSGTPPPRQESRGEARRRARRRAGSKWSFFFVLLAAFIVAVVAVCSSSLLAAAVPPRLGPRREHQHFHPRGTKKQCSLLPPLDTIQGDGEKGGQRRRKREREEGEGKKACLSIEEASSPSRPFFLFSFSRPQKKKPFPPQKRKKNKKKQALLQLEYPDKLQRLLLTPQREVLVELVITRDNGEIEVRQAEFEKKEKQREREFSFLRPSSTLKKKNEKKTFSEKKPKPKRPLLPTACSMTTPAGPSREG